MDDLERIEIYRAQRRIAYEHLKYSHQLMLRSQRLFHSLESRYIKDREEWESVDRKLAMLDGRFERLEEARILAESNTKGYKKPKVKVDLTEEQILAIAEKLGIVLPEVIG